MGRTRAWTPATATVALGNRDKRFAVNFFHAIGPATSRDDSFVHSFVGNVVRNATSWAIAIEDTHFSEFRRNVIFGAGGSGIVAVQGNEYENVIEGNFVLGVVGTGQLGIVVTYR